MKEWMKEIVKMNEGIDEWMKKENEIEIKWKGNEIKKESIREKNKFGKRKIKE